MEKHTKVHKLFAKQPFWPKLFLAKHLSSCCILGGSKHCNDASSWLGDKWVKRNFPRRKETLRKKWMFFQVWHTGKNETVTLKQPIEVKNNPYLFMANSSWCHSHTFWCKSTDVLPKFYTIPDCFFRNNFPGGRTDDFLVAKFVSACFFLVNEALQRHQKVLINTKLLNLKAEKRCFKKLR